MDKTQLKNLPMVEIAEVILMQKNEPMDIYELIDEVRKIKGIEDQADEKVLQLYMDITLSAKFVFVGDDKWSLKDGYLEFWDKDGFYFISPQDLEEIDYEDDEDEEEFEVSDYSSEDEDEDDLEDEDDEDLDEEEKEEKEYIDVGIELTTTDDDDKRGIDISFDSDDYDEEDYNEIMDDYEDMYED